MRLAKFRGLNRATLHLDLKECEFRFNHRRDNLCRLLLNNFKINPINWSRTQFFKLKSTATLK
jgi:hypothetical protein